MPFIPALNYLILNYNIIATRGLILVISWTIAWTLFGDSTLPPDGPIYSMFVLYLTAVVIGKLCEIFYISSIFGMLVGGLVLSNTSDKLVFDRQMSSSLRSFALAVILLRAGLRLDPVALRRLSWVCVRLSFIPCMVEAIAFSIVAKFVLILPWSWAFLLGFVIAGVSPAVVVPGMISKYSHTFYVGHFLLIITFYRCSRAILRSQKRNTHVGHRFVFIRQCLDYHQFWNRTRIRIRRQFFIFSVSNSERTPRSGTRSIGRYCSWLHDSSISIGQKSRPNHGTAIDDLSHGNCRCDDTIECVIE